MKSYFKLFVFLVVTLTISLMAPLGLPRVEAASPGISTLTFNSQKGTWQEGNPGSSNEGTMVCIEVIITNPSKTTPYSPGEIDLRFSFYDGLTKSIGIDYASKFYYAINAPFTTGSSYLDPAITQPWKEVKPIVANWPWKVTGIETDTNPAVDHYWGIVIPESIPGGGSVAIYFEAHLAYSFIWQNGVEGSLDINGYNTSTTIDRTNWKAKYNGAGYYPGSKLHGVLENTNTGSKTLQMPAVSQVNGSISGYKILDMNGDGIKDTNDTGLANWPITLTANIGVTQINILKITNTDGSYIFSNLPYVTFKVTEGERAGYIPSISSGTSYTINLSANGPISVTNKNFYNTPAPPVASFIFFGFEDPKDTAKPLESAVIRLKDTSTVMFPAGKITSWYWEVVKDGDKNRLVTSYLQNPVFIPPDNGAYEVKLTVTDSNGKTDTEIRSISVANAKPKAKALNVEVISGMPAELLGRFIDPGWLDSKHTANWKMGNNTIPGAIQEDGIPFMGTGIVSGTVNTELSVNGELTVTDKDNESSATANFRVTVIDNKPDDRETPNNRIISDGLPKINADSIIRSFIQEPGDVDLYEILNPTGGAFAAGSEILVQLKGLPADYDIIILGQVPVVQTAGFMSGGFMSGGFMSGGFMSGGFMSGGFMSGGFMSGGFMSGGFMSGSYSRSGFMSGGFMSGGFMSGGFMSGGFMSGQYDAAKINQYPLSQMGFTGVDPDRINGTDMSLEELGLGNIGGTNIQVLSFSANQGLAEEVLLVRTDYSGEKIFVAVVGHNGVFDTKTPYVLQVEASDPVDMSAWLSQLKYDHGYLATYSKTVTEIIGGSGVTTLFVTQQERMEARYGNASWVGLLQNLTTLAGQPGISGKIISVPSNIYEGWDNNPWSVEEANKVALAIRNEIQKEMSKPGAMYEYVVIVGDDDIIPFYRMPDKTAIGNERDYVVDSFTKPGSPLFSSLVGGFVQTDDYYVGTPVLTGSGQALYIPTISISRLVETPADIKNAIEAFNTASLDMSTATALVTGYDFFRDGAQAEIDYLATLLTGTKINPLLSDDWTALNLLDELKKGYDISALNAHYTHYAALSANGFKNKVTDILTSTDLSGIPIALKNSIIFTMGCHAGLSVPDGTAFSPTEIGLPINPKLDVPQVAVNKAAIYIASTGTGLGDDKGMAGTEELMGIFTRNLLTSPTAGKAFAKAKQEYLAGLSKITEYEVKSSVQFTMYGLPQFAISKTAMNNYQATPVSTSATANVPFSLTIDDKTTTHSLQLTSVAPSADGQFYAANGGNILNTPFRPIQPEIKITPSKDGGLVHGALLLSGTFEDFTDFDPVISRPTFDWDSENAVEPQTSPSGFWPAELATVNTLRLSDTEFLQNLVIIPGQFQPAEPNANPLTGTERLFSQLELKLLRSADRNDWKPPVVQSCGIQKIDAGVEITLDATDTAGIARIVITLIRINKYSTVINDISPQLVNGIFSYTISNYLPGDRFIIQVVDPAGNITVVTGKGATLKLIDVNLTDGVKFTPGTTATFTGTVSGLNTGVPCSYIWDFGDGTIEEGGKVTILSATERKVEKTHKFDWRSSEYKVTVKVVSVDGGVGIDSTQTIITPTESATTLAISPTTALVFGQNVTFTVTVTPKYPEKDYPVVGGMPIPSGTVTLSAQSTFNGQPSGAPLNLGSYILTNDGKATISTAALPSGSLDITATYLGNAYYQGSAGKLTGIIVRYRFGSFTSPIDNSQYNIGRNVPIKFTFVDSAGKSIKISASVYVVFWKDNDPTKETIKFGPVLYDTLAERYQIGIDLVPATFSPGLYTILVIVDGQYYGVEGNLWQINLR